MDFSHFTPRAPRNRIIGHRGVAALAPENTMASFKLAATQQIEWIEFDVRLTSDNQLIIFHDDTLERTTNGKGLVEDCSAEALRSLDAGSWFSSSYQGEKIPFLAESLPQLVKLNLYLNIELKFSASPHPTQVKKMAHGLVNLLEQYWPKSRPLPLVSSFYWPVLHQIRKLAPAFPLGFLHEEPSLEEVKALEPLTNVALHAHYLRLTEEIFDLATRKKIPLLAYTVNDRLAAEKLLKLGAFALFSDNPSAILSEGYFHYV